MSRTIDPLNTGRLRILTALAEAPQQAQEFVRLRSVTELTDGNLATHARRLSAAGLLSIDKRLRDGKPVTTFVLTTQGRRALEGHLQRLSDALSPASVPRAALARSDDDWID